MFLLGAAASAQLIDSVNLLGSTIASGTGGERAVGFLSTGNYHAVSSVLPRSIEDGGQMEVVLFDSLEEIEAAVLDGTIVAGLSTSRPENPNGTLVEFPASVVTMRAPMYRPSDGEAALDSQHLREAMDAATVRAIADGSYQALESQYFASNGFDSVAAFSCGIDVTKFPFPAAADAQGLLAAVLARGSLRVGALGPSNWGYQGRYTQDPITGFWPEYLEAILSKFGEAYPGIALERVWNSSSDGVMESVLSGATDVTEPYWTVSGWFHGRARSEHLELGCTVLGTESIFFTKAPVSAVQPSREDDNELEDWLIGLIVAGAAALCALCTLIAVMTHREKAGRPLFTTLDAADVVATRSATTDVSNKA